MAERAVVNASPLIFLGAADRLDLLRLAGNEIVIPKPVYREVTSDQRGSQLGRIIETLDWLTVTEPTPVPDSIVAWDLGAGEAVVLSLALVRSGTVAIVDDLAGRKCARAHGISLKGTLGLVLSARKLQPPARPLQNVEGLQQLALRIADAERTHRHVFGGHQVISDRHIVCFSRRVVGGRRNRYGAGLRLAVTIR